MAIFVWCPDCDRKVYVDFSERPKYVTCKKCRYEFKIYEEDYREDTKQVEQPRKKRKPRKETDEWLEKAKRDVDEDDEIQRSYELTWDKAVLFPLALLPLGIMVLTQGGCIWGMLGGAVAGACAGVVSSRGSVLTRLAILLGINITLYAAIGVMVSSLKKKRSEAPRSIPALCYKYQSPQHGENGSDENSGDLPFHSGRRLAHRRAVDLRPHFRVQSPLLVLRHTIHLLESRGHSPLHR